MSQKIHGYRFGDCELDLGLMELRRHGVMVRIQRRQFDLLLYLIENRDRLVPRAELLMNLWPEVSVSECALSTSLRGVRRLIGDDGRRQQMIETRRGFGVRFSVPVVARSHRGDVLDRASPATSLGDRLSPSSPFLKKGAQLWFTGVGPPGNA